MRPEGLGSIRQLGVRQIDPPARGAGPRQGTRRERAPRRSGAKSISCVVPKSGTCLPYDHAAVLRYRVLHNPNFGNWLAFRQLSVIDSAAIIGSLNPEPVGAP